MIKNPMGNFEIPPEMRNVAEHSVVQARQAFDHFMSAAQKAAAQIESQTAVAKAGAKDAGEKMIEFAERNVTTSFDFAQRLVRAKDLEEMMKLQTEFVRSQMEALAEQAQAIGQGVSQATKDAVSGRKSR
jgi:phasin